MSHAITKTDEHNLHELAKAICERERTLLEFKDKAFSFASQAVAEALLQGQQLLKAKEIVPHGVWLEWLRANCPNVHERMAQRYMSLALNPTRVSDLERASSLRAALTLLCEPQENGGVHSPKQSWPEYLEGLYRFGKVLKFVTSHPIDRWPDEGRDKLRSDLEPVARSLWPERWGTSQ